MPKITLSQAYVHDGSFYGPGEVDVSEAAAKDLQAREDARKQSEPATLAEATGLPPQAAPDVTATQTPSEPERKKR